MSGIVPAVLAVWVGVCLALFARLSGRDAALIALIGGWACLPVALFPASVFAEPIGTGGSMHALAIPTSILMNKATAIALGCLAGSMIFDWPSIRRIRPSRLDIPLIIWCLTPIASALANGLGLAEGLSQARYLSLAWGVPYLMGRAYLVDQESFRRFGLGLVLAGLAYVPVCLFEVFRGPSLYTLIYGAHPYQLTGAARPILFRPMGWMECGNQLGMWMANAAVAAVWLWRSEKMPSNPRWAGAVVACVLIAVCVASQSLGSIVLMVAALIPLMVSRLGFRTRSAYATVAVLGALSLSAGIVAVGMADRSMIRGTFHGVGKDSFTWRFGRYEESLPRVADRPILGWARADWSSKTNHTFVDPVGLGLFMPTLGMYGIVGLVASTVLLALPVVEVVKWLPMPSWFNPNCSTVTLAAILLAINIVDSLFNSALLLPLLAAAGGIHTWSLRRYEMR